jgi:hypothetical protein
MANRAVSGTGARTLGGGFVAAACVAFAGLGRSGAGAESTRTARGRSASDPHRRVGDERRGRHRKQPPIPGVSEPILGVRIWRFPGFAFREIPAKAFLLREFLATDPRSKATDLRSKRTDPWSKNGRSWEEGPPILGVRNADLGGKDYRSWVEEMPILGVSSFYKSPAKWSFSGFLSAVLLVLCSLCCSCFV